MSYIIIIDNNLLKFVKNIHTISKINSSVLSMHVAIRTSNTHVYIHYTECTCIQNVIIHSHIHY